MPTSEAYRRLVVARAGGACEYCRLLQDASGVTFHVEHVRPRSAGGLTELANLALSCPGCNLSKSKRLVGADATGQVVAIYNPRDYEPASLGWHLHFEIDRNTGLIRPRSATGEATVQALNMNDPLRAYARKLQIDAGLIG
jgi:HNH endonuclease